MVNEFQSFQQRKSKGKEAEAIVHDYLISKKFIVHECHQDAPHLIDFFVMKTDQHGIKKQFAVEVKRNQVWNASALSNPSTKDVHSIMVKHWNEYVDFCMTNSMTLIIFIVDMKAKQLKTVNFMDLVKVTTPQIQGQKMNAQDVFPQRVEFMDNFNIKEAVMIFEADRCKIVHTW